MPLPKGKTDGSDGSISDDSDVGAADQKRVLNFLASSEDPRTTSQIKRSRIDLARRYVFLCPMSLSKHFESLPHQAKDSALLVFRCSRNWLFPDSSEVRKSRTEARVDCGVSRPGRRHPHSSSTSMSSGTLAAALHHSEFSREFLQWVRTKEKEDCVFWYKPEKDLRKLSAFFEEKIDPANELPYRPLLLDPQWWRVRFIRTNAKYVSKPSVVVAIITGNDISIRGDIDMLALQELIYQSNTTLEPISKWPHAPSMRFLPRTAPANRNYAGHESKTKGYIDQEILRNGCPIPCSNMEEQTRIACWPELPRDRFDNLHHLWQCEEASSERRHVFAQYGASTFKGGSFSAR